MISKVSKEIPSIYFLKVLMTIFIILLHAGCFFGSDRFYLLVWPLFRIAVPVFFMISGYFLCADSVEKYHNHVCRKIGSLVKFGLVSILMYTVYTMATQGVPHVIAETVSFKSVVLFLVSNRLPYGEHLWYIFAYIYLILFTDVFFIIKKDISVSWGGVIFLLSISYVAIFIFCFIVKMPDVVSRSWLICGLPCFFVGWLARRHKLSEMTNQYLLVSIIIFLIIISIIENNNYCNYKMGDLYFSTIPLSLCLFLYFIKNKDFGNKWLSNLGKRYSMWIYVAHIMAIGVVKHACLLLNPDKNLLLGVVCVFLVFIISVIFSIFMDKLFGPFLR